jgi:hypothetical protein
MPSKTQEPAVVSGLDVALEDVDLVDEVALLGELIAALNSVYCRLSSRELDALLGLR